MNLKQLKPKEIELLNDILDYIEDSEALDFEEQCSEKEIQFNELLNDDGLMKNHIYFKAVTLRRVLT